jgi:hypothetical protein
MSQPENETPTVVLALPNGRVIESGARSLCLTCGDWVRVRTPDGVQHFDPAARAHEPATLMRDLLRAAGANESNGELSLALASGETLCSRDGEDAWLESNGLERLYWHCDEWACEPALVIGAILNAASGFVPERG